MSIFIIICLIVIIIIYKMQIRRISKELEFINNNNTNMELSEDSLLSDINNLSKQINIVLQNSQNNYNDICRSEELFKETIVNISHDIRTPLTSLDGYFQLLKKCDSDEKKERYIAIIHERITSLNNMLEELFMYTKIQNNNYNFIIDKVDFGKIVRDTVFSFYEDFKNKGYEPNINFSEQVYYVNGNQEALKRVLFNIIKNAMVHGVSKIELNLYKKDDSVVFECSNDMSIDDLKTLDGLGVSRVFEKFYKADSARTQSSSGLGLAISKGLVDKMNGKIIADIKEERFLVRVEFFLDK